MPRVCSPQQRCSVDIIRFVRVFTKPAAISAIPKITHGVDHRTGKFYQSKQGGHTVSVLSRGFWKICGYCSRLITSAQAIPCNLKGTVLRGFPHIRKNVLVRVRVGAREREGWRARKDMVWAGDRGSNWWRELCCTKKPGMSPEVLLRSEEDSPDSRNLVVRCDGSWQ